MEVELPAADDDAVEGIVHPLPRQFQQSEFGEGLVQGLSGSQSANVVKPRVIMQSAAPETLHAASRLARAFQHEHLEASLCKQCAALHAAKAAAYDENIEHDVRVCGY